MSRYLLRWFTHTYKANYHDRKLSIISKLSPQLQMTSASGASIPWGNDAFPSVSDFPLFPKHFSDSVINVRYFTFSNKISKCSSAKISDDLNFSLTTNFEFLPYFRWFNTHFPLFCENYYFPSTFQNFHSDFTYFLCFSFPTQFHHDAFMHHTMHVLDAPAQQIIFG